MRGLCTGIFFLLLGGLALPVSPANAAHDPGAIRRSAHTLADAYPVAGFVVLEREGGLWLEAGETRIFHGSLQSGSCDAKPDDPDGPLCAIMRQAYPAGDGHRSPEEGFDPGRVRNEALLKFLYGKDRHEVEKDLVPVTFFTEVWLFSSRHGAADALRRVVAKLEAAAEKDPGLNAYILPGGGTYAWRTIKDSTRLSAHSFGTAIDLNIEKGLYWLWGPSASELAATRREYPQLIVDAFESEGFIWGGKWHSFDFMHFEYRPEFFPVNALPPR